jgi:hypothetical protein
VTTKSGIAGMVDAQPNAAEQITSTAAAWPGVEEGGEVGQVASGLVELNPRARSRSVPTSTEPVESVRLGGAVNAVTRSSANRTGARQPLRCGARADHSSLESIWQA